MSSPKHLWSGDWDQHASAETPPPARIPAAPAPQERPGMPEPPRRSARVLALSGVVALFLVAAVVVVLVATNGSKTKTPTLTIQQAQVPTVTTPNPSGGGGLIPTTPQSPSPTTPQSSAQSPSLPSAVQSGPTYNWLGMQISATGSGVTVATVDIGGAADTAGVDPGDVIAEVNGQQINSIQQLNSAVAGLTIGKTFQLTVDRGSTVVSITPTLANRPKRQ